MRIGRRNVTGRIILTDVEGRRQALGLAI